MVGQQLEREDKIDVPDDYRLPDLQDLLPEGGRWESAEYKLGNTYFDTPSAHLAQFGVTLRRREGGPDAGWHLEVLDDDARTEISDGSNSITLPEELAKRVVGVRAGEELGPIAEVTVMRTVHRLVGDAGAVMVEVADDRVSAVTVGAEARISSWREGRGGAEACRRLPAAATGRDTAPLCWRAPFPVRLEAAADPRPPRPCQGGATPRHRRRSGLRLCRRAVPPDRPLRHPVAAGRTLGSQVPGGHPKAPQHPERIRASLRRSRIGDVGARAGLAGRAAG